MATKFFKQSTKAECAAAPAEGRYGLCNISAVKIEVDEEGHWIAPHQCAIIDSSNPVMDELVRRGQLVVAEPTAAAPKPSRSRKKEKVEEAVEEDPVEAEVDPEVAADSEEV